MKNGCLRPGKVLPMLVVASSDPLQYQIIRVARIDSLSYGPEAILLDHVVVRLSVSLKSISMSKTLLGESLLTYAFASDHKRLSILHLKEQVFRRLLINFEISLMILRNSQGKQRLEEIVSVGYLE